MIILSVFNISFHLIIVPNIRFSRCFPYIDGLSFSPYKPLQNVRFRKVSNMHFFSKNHTHILTKTQGKKFQYMFLVKIASKGTSLNTKRFTRYVRRLPSGKINTKKLPEKLFRCLRDP